MTFWPPAAPPPMKYISSCWEDQRLSTKGKVVSKYCNISKNLGSSIHNPPPPPPAPPCTTVEVRICVLRSRVNSYVTDRCAMLYKATYIQMAFKSKGISYSFQSYFYLPKQVISMSLATSSINLLTFSCSFLISSCFCSIRQATKQFLATKRNRIITE